MATLTDTEQAQLVEILGLPHPLLVISEVTLATPAQEVILKADIARFQVVRGQYGSLNGHNAAGVEFDPGDERADIRKRIIAMLRCGQTVARYAANRAASGGRIIRS